MLNIEEDELIQAYRNMDERYKFITLSSAKRLESLCIKNRIPLLRLVSNNARATSGAGCVEEIQCKR